LEIIKSEFPNNIWWDFSFFFTDGLQLNVGSDYGLVPSMFEPGGLVQLEYLVADTPVICSETGGLKDTVMDVRNTNQQESKFNSKLKPNGFLFPPGNTQALVTAILDA
jgi:starch synthase